jgi:hypothetical protein
MQLTLSSTLPHLFHHPSTIQVKLDVPAIITHVQLSDGSTGIAGRTPPLLKLFARDLCTCSAARFAPLCSSTISCAEASTSTFRTEPVLTDHVVIRGRYTNVSIVLLGTLDHDRRSQGDFADDKHQLFETTKVKLGSRALSAAVAAAAAAPVPPSLPLLGAGASVVACGSLPLPVLPAAFARALQTSLQYYGEVRRSHKQILANPPGHRLKQLRLIADAVCEALQGLQSFALGCA